MRFETISDFRSFDSVFGKYVRYGSTEPHPSVGGINVMRNSHVMTTMGQGMGERLKFKRRSVTSLGLDFKYNEERQIMMISLRYKLIRADKDTTLRSFIDKRRTITGSTRTGSVSNNVSVPYSVTIKKETEFRDSNIQYVVLHDYNHGKDINCEIVESEVLSELGTVQTFDVAYVHKLILEYICTLNN